MLRVGAVVYGSGLFGVIGSGRKSRWCCRYGVASVNEGLMQSLILPVVVVGLLLCCT